MGTNENSMYICSYIYVHVYSLCTGHGRRTGFLKIVNTDRTMFDTHENLRTTNSLEARPVALEADIFFYFKISIINPVIRIITIVKSPRIYGRHALRLHTSKRPTTERELRPQRPQAFPGARPPLGYKKLSPRFTPLELRWSALGGESKVL